MTIQDIEKTMTVIKLNNHNFIVVNHDCQISPELTNLTDCEQFIASYSENLYWIQAANNNRSKELEDSFADEHWKLTHEFDHLK